MYHMIVHWLFLFTLLCANSIIYFVEFCLPYTYHNYCYYLDKFDLTSLSTCQAKFTTVVVLWQRSVLFVQTVLVTLWHSKWLNILQHSSLQLLRATVSNDCSCRHLLLLAPSTIITPGNTSEEDNVERPWYPDRIVSKCEGRRIT